MNLSYVILGPVVTEKSMHTVDKTGQHTVYIHADATKIDVKSAIKKFFGAGVSSVQIIKLPIKIRVRGKNGPQIKRKVRKKAIIRLNEGHTLDLLKLASEPKEKSTKKVSATAEKTDSSAKE